MKIYLVRHGQDEDNANGILNGHRDTPLTSIGIEQAKVLAQKVKDLDLGIEKVFASPLQRAYKTAEEITDLIGLSKPEKLDLLIERDFGTMSGKNIQDIEKLCAPDIVRTSTITYFLSPQGAETFPILYTRAEKILRWLSMNCSAKRVLLVTHGDIGKMIYASFYGLAWQDVLLGFHFGNSEVLLLEQGSKPEDRHVHKVKQHNH